LAEPPFEKTIEGLKLRLRVTPKARRNEIGPFVANAQGNAVLKVAVTAPPADGRANKAVVALLAKTWRLPKSAIDIARGTHDRNKVALIHCDAGVLMAALDRHLEQGTDDP